MFQPQPTPFQYFASYGDTSASNFHVHGLDSLNFDYQTIAPGSRLDAGGPILLTDPFNVSSATSTLSFHDTSRSSNPMEGLGINSDLEAQQAAASHYQPDLKGPLVGNRKSSHVITEEYARADPIYVTKTAALPQTYSHYRPVLGDGNCGWRAIAFCYFEILQKLGDKSRAEEELGRMMSMSDFIQNATGYDSMVFEDMQEVVLNLLQKIGDSAHLGAQTDSSSAVLQTLNDKESSDSIVYFFRLLASSWMQTYPQDYAGFIPDGLTVDAYRKSYIEPIDMEIEHLGMTVLIDVLLKPIGISVEIAYLDRSHGTQVTTHVIQAMDGSGNPTNPGGPIVHLLYRPGHYDILYKEPLGGAPMQTDLQSHIASSSNMEIRRVASIGHQDTNWAPVGLPNFGGAGGFDMGLMASIPGMSFAGPPQHDFSTFDNYDLSPKFETPKYEMPQSTYCLSPSNTTHHSASPTSSSSVGFPSLQSIQPSQVQQPVSPHALAVPHHSHSVSMPSTTSSELLQSHHGASLSPMSQQQSHIHQIRRSRYEVEREFEHPPPPPLQTTTFKNSHYNVAHFNNPDFQPEEWKPEDEDESCGHAHKSRGRSL